MSDKKKPQNKAKGTKAKVKDLTPKKDPKGAIMFPTVGGDTTLTKLKTNLRVNNPNQFGPLG